VNFGERWYDPREENFLSPEPLLQEDIFAVVDDPSLLSAYTYAASNPLRYVDPDGRAPRIADNGFVVGEAGTFEKHQSGNITISASSRANREAPKITFGGRYSNDAAGQQLSDSFQKHADRADRFSTILAISTEDGKRKVRVFGVTVKETDVGDHASPGPSPSDSGADQGDVPIQPPAQQGAPPAPDAQAAANQAPPDQTDDGGAANAPGDAGPGAQPPDDGGDGQDAPAPPRPPARPPANAAPAADGPDD
jgi:RHS repeat-associated protein